MSQWTHVNAVIRFDGLSTGFVKPPDLGFTCTYESTADEWAKCNVPKGSKGSLQYHVWENPNENSMASHTVMFWGDLRDYEDAEEILAYFKKITEGQLIRSGILEINIEFSDPMTYRFDTDKWVLLNP